MRYNKIATIMATVMANVALILSSLLLLSGCQNFIFGQIDFNYNESPAVQHKMPTSGADTITPPRVTIDIPNPDRGGALDNWATCLVMFKEGHPHGGDLLHGNFVYQKAPWQQEMFAFAHNRPSGVEVEVMKESTVTFLERQKGLTGPGYIRIIGGSSKLWGLCLYFFDKEGNRLNDQIYDHSDEYQIFFTISDVDDKGQPYDVMDVRFRNGRDNQAEFGKSKWGQINELAYQKEQPVVSPFYSKYRSWEERAEATPNLFTYTYRDTWTQGDMNDGATQIFNIRLLPPFTRFNYYGADAYYDQDRVGLKGHLKFDMLNKYFSPRYGNEEGDFNDTEHEWPIERLTESMIGNSKTYTRAYTLLPQFYLSVRVMKCAKGQKALLDMPKDGEGGALGRSDKVCDPSYAPGKQWKEIIRFNVPIKVYTSMDDSDPTGADAHEPYYVHLAREIGLKPIDAFNEVKNVQTHGSNGGFASWFL